MSVSPENQKNLVYAQRFADFVERHLVKLEQTWSSEPEALEALSQAWRSQVLSTEEDIKERLQSSSYAEIAPDSDKRKLRERNAYIAKLNALKWSRGLLHLDKRQEMIGLSTEALWLCIGEYQEKLKSSEGCFDGHSSPSQNIYLKNPNFPAPIMTYYRSAQIFGWQLPLSEDIATIARLCKGKRLLEVNAGCGLWGRFLREAGVEITCTDVEPPDFTYYPVQKLSWEAAGLQSANYDILLTIWPPFNSESTLTELVRLFKQKEVIFIGEEWGCTGSDALFEELQSWTEEDEASREPQIRRTDYDVYATAMARGVKMIHFQTSRLSD